MLWRQARGVRSPAIGPSTSPYALPLQHNSIAASTTPNFTAAYKPVLYHTPFPLTCLGQHLAHKHENGLFRADFDPLADHIHKLTDGQVSWDEVPGRRTNGTGSCRDAGGMNFVKALPCQSPNARPLPSPTYFFLSMSGMSLFSAFSTMTCRAGRTTRMSASQPHGPNAVLRKRQASRDLQGSCRDTCP